MEKQCQNVTKHGLMKSFALHDQHNSSLLDQCHQQILDYLAQQCYADKNLSRDFHQSTRVLYFTYGTPKFVDHIGSRSD